MKHRTKRVTKIFILLVLILLVAVALVGCSPKGEIDGGLSKDPGKTSYTAINKDTAQNYVKAAMENRKAQNVTDGSEEWFVIDLTLDVDSTDFSAGYKEVTKIKLILKANWNLKDNNKSELLLNIVDSESLTTVFGVYYVAGTMYVSIMDGVAGYENMHYRFDEVNFTVIAQMIAPLLNSIGGVDPLVLLMSLGSATTATEIGGFLTKLGVLDVGTYLGLVDGIAQGIIFDTGKGKSTYMLSDNGNTETIGFRLKANDILDLFKNFGSIATLLKLPFDVISWDAFGLPDFDPILEQFLGFSLAKVREYPWPKMTEAFLKGINTKEKVDGKDEFVLNGLEFAFKADATDKYPDGQYDTKVKISPFFLGSKKEKIDISFSGLGLTSDSTKYREGGLLNLETQLTLDFEAPRGTVITVGDIVGDTMDELLPSNDLTSLKKLPISFNGFNFEDERGQFTRYKFDLELKVDLDLFNGENNNAEINIYAQDKKILSVYLVGTTLYIYTEGLKGASFSIPNISIPNIDLTALLFGDGGALAVIMPYLNPNYTPVEESNPSNGNVTNAPSNAEPIDIMALLKSIVTYKSYYNWKGEKITNETGNITLPGKEDAPLVISFDKDAINELMMNFLPSADLGLEGLSISTMLGHPQDSTKIEIELPKGIKAKIQVSKIAWLGKPDFDFSNVENATYTPVGGTANFFIEMGGDFQLGIQKDENAAKVVLNLSDLLATLTQNIFLDIGLKVSDTAGTKIRYEVKANFDMEKMDALNMASYISFRKTSFAVYLYAGDSTKHFIMLYYNGTDDMLFLDLSNLPELQEAIPLFKIFKPSQPNLKIKLGLDQLLSNQPPLAVGVALDKNISNTDLIMMMLTGTPFTTTNPNNAAAALDIVDLIGKLLEGIYVQDDTLSIIASKQMLTVLLSVLNVQLGEGTVLPGTNIFGKLNVMNPDPDKGFLELHLGLVGEGGAGTEFLAMDIHLINKIDVTGNPKDFKVVDDSFNPDNYQNLYEVMKTLVVAFELGGKLQLEPLREGGFSLGDLLAKLIGAKYFDPYLNTVQISSNLEFKFKANIDISGLNIPEGGQLQFDSSTLLNSEVELTITDAANGKNQEILAIYYKGQDLYINLSYFLGAQGYIQLTNAGDFIANLLAGSAMSAVQRTFYSAAGAVEINTGANSELSAINLSILATIAPYGLTVAIAEGALTNLLAGLLGLDSESMIHFGEFELGLGIQDGINLSFSTSIENALEINFELGDLSISANPNDKVKVVIPQDVKWVKSDAATLLNSVLVKLEASIGVGGKGSIDLSPIITSLLSKSDDPNAAKIDINVFIENLGLAGAELNIAVEADLNFQAIAKSKFRISLFRGAVAENDVLLTAIYDGANNKLYIKTQLFGICNDKDEFKELDIDKLSNVFMQNSIKEASVGEKAVEVRNSPFMSMFGKNAAGDDALKQFIQIIFVEGGIQLKVAQEALIFLFSALGVDATEFFENFTLDATGELSIHPVSISLHANLNNGAFTFDMALKNLSVAFGGEMNLQDLNDAIASGKVTKIESFTSLGVNLSGTLSANVSSGDDKGEIYFNDLIANILGAVQLPAGIDGASLSALGLLFKVVGGNKDGYPNFGGTLHYSIGGVINIVKIENLYLTLKLGTTSGSGDVLDIIVRGSASADKDSTGVDIYVNAEKLLGIKPFVIKHVTNFIKIFNSTGFNIKGDNQNGQKTPQLNRSGAVQNLFSALTMHKDGTDAAFANAIVLYMAANYEELGLKAPIVLDVGAGALYGIVESLFGVNIGKYFEGHDVFAELTAGGSEALISLDLGLQGFVELSLNLLSPTIDLQPKIPDAPLLTDYTVLDDNFTTLKVSLKGQASLKGNFTADQDPNDPQNKNTINLANIIGNFLTGVNFDILVNLLGDVDKTMKFKVDVAVNLKKIIVGDWSGLSGTVEFFDVADKLLIGAYYLDGNMYLDLTALNMGKLCIDNFAVFLQSIIGGTGSAASKDALNAIPGNAQQRDQALNLAAAQAYINILMGNDTGIMLEVTADAVALVLSAISIDGATIDGNLIKDTMHGILSLKLGIFSYDPESDEMQILGLSVNIASYSAALSFNKFNIDFENTDVRPDDFTKWQAEFGVVGELSEWIYIKAAFNFGWHLSDGMTVDFSDILGTFLSSTLDTVSIAPILKILNEFGQDFKLEIEGKIHFGNLMRDGTLLPDLMGAGGINIDVLMGSELSIKLICTTGDQDKEVISLSYVNKSLYVDLSAFSIGKVYIRDAYNFFVSMFAPGNTPAALAYALPYSSNPAANANNDADYIAKQIGVIGAFINMNISSSAVALHIGTAGLFAILQVAGLDLSSTGLTLNGLYDMINPLGDIDIAVWLATKDNLLELVLSLKEWVKDSEGNLVEPSEREIGLKLGIDSDFRIMLGDKKITDEFGENVVDIADPDSYDRLTDDALVSVATKLDFKINLKEGTVENVFKDPLQSLIGSLLTQIALSIGVQVMDDMEGIVTLSIMAEVPLMTVIAGLTAGGFDISGINAKIEVIYKNKAYATLILSRGDLFADLSLLGGPKGMITDMMGLLSGGGAAASKNNAVDNGNKNAPQSAEGDTSLLPKLPISLELMQNGFFLTVKKAAFNTIFSLINVNGKNLGDWEITDDIRVVLGLTGTDNPIYGEDGKSFKLGGELAFTQGDTDIIALGIDLNGIGAKFAKIDGGIERPDPSEYADIMQVDTIIAAMSLEFSLRVNGQQEVNLQKVIETLLSSLGAANPLGIPIAPQIKTKDLLEDTLRLDLKVAVNIGGFATGNINDILGGIKVKASLYSIGRPDFFKIDIAFDNSMAYIDATTIGLGKILLPVNSLLAQILGGSSPAAKAVATSIVGNGAAMAAPMNSKEAEARKLLSVTNLMFGMDGITAIVAYDTIGTILQMLGVPIGDYLDGVIAPSVEINVTDEFGFNIIAHILTGKGESNEDEIVRMGLSLVGGTTSVDVKVSSIQQIVSFVPEDAHAYVPYDELMLTLSINASISIEFLKGYIPLDSVLDLIISNMKMGIAIGETHQLAFALNGKIGLDLKKFLEKSPTSFFGELSLDYIITSNGGATVYDQTIAKIFIVEDGVYVELKLQDIGLDLKVKVPDLNIPSLIWDLIDGKDPFASAAAPKNNGLHQVSDEKTTDVPFPAPLTTLLKNKAQNANEGDYALPILISLGSEGLSVEISTLLLATILPLLGLQIEKPEDFIESILSSGKLAISTDPTFRIFFRLQKDPGGDLYVDKNGNSHERGGYVFELSLFHGTEISLDSEKYLNFASRFTTAYESDGYGMVTSPDFGNNTFAVFAQDFLPFNLKKLIAGGEFDIIEDFISTLGGKVELELGVDFKSLVFDLSALFENEENAFFYIKIAEALKSSMRIVLEFDASLKGIIKNATLGVDAILRFENEYGDNLLTLMIRGGGSGVSSEYEDGIYPAMYLYSETMGIPKLKVNSPILKNFANLDLNALLKGLGLNVNDSAQGASTVTNGAKNSNGGVQNGLLDPDGNGLIMGGINIAELFNSISINPGRIAIVMAQTIIKDILAALLNFPFEDVEDISVTLSDGLYLNIELQKGFAIKMALDTLEVNLGGRAVFGKSKTEVIEMFAGYISLSDYKWSFELESELTITDDLISVFSLSKMTTPLIGADVTIEAGEVLGTKMTFLLKGFIDFANLSNISLQLAMVSGGKQYINIMYVGNADNPEASYVYLDMTGLGLTSLKLNLDIGSIVKNLLGTLTGNAEETPDAASKFIGEVANGAANAMRPADTKDGGGGTINYKDIEWGLDEGGSLADVPFGAQLLLLAIGSSDVSVAITGALLSALMHGLTQNFALPDINYIRVGYVEGMMAGIELVLNEENFRIAYSFTGNSKSGMSTTMKNPVDPLKNALGEKLDYSMSDIGVIRQIFLALNMEIRVNTRNAKGGKSSQVEGVESFIEKLIGVPDGTVDFAPQAASLIFNLNLQLALDLENLNKTKLALTISLGDTDLIALFFDGKSVYADLSGLNLFEVKISGLDIITLILNLLGDTLDLDGGLKVEDLINGMLPASKSGANNASGGTASGTGTAANAARPYDSGVSKRPQIRVVLTNDSLYIIPSMSSIGAIVEKITKKPLGFDLPDIAEIRLGINLKDGLNNLSLKLKLDNYNNGADVNIPSDGGLALKLNDPNQKVLMPNNFNTYGGISGLNLSNGGISISLPGLVGSLIDSIDAPNNLSIYLKKRNTYFFKTINNAYVYNDSINPTKDPAKDPLNNGDYSSSDLKTNVQTSAGIVARRDQATNYLELKVDIASRNDSISVRYDRCRIKLLFGSFKIKILGISINLGSIIGVFAKEGLDIATLIIPDLIENGNPTPPIVGTTGNLAGRITDETGNPVQGATVVAEKDGSNRTATSDRLGNYAFSSMPVGEYKISYKKTGGYYDVIRESVEIKDMQKFERVQTLDIQMFTIGTTTNTFTQVYISGFVKDADTGVVIAGAKVYIDNRRIEDTTASGAYGEYYKEISGTRHSIIVQADNYQEFETSIDINANGQMVGVSDIRLKPIAASKGVIHGKLTEWKQYPVYDEMLEKEVQKYGYRPVTSDVEIWLVKSGSTLRDGINPFDFLGWNADGIRLGTLDSNGEFSIPNLEYGDYTLKFRSATYKNINLISYPITLTRERPSYVFEGDTLDEEGLTAAVPNQVFNGKIALTRRATDHFTQNTYTNSMITGIRIRLGADVLDGDGNTSGAGDTVGNVFETGAKDGLDSVIYIEAWLGENLVTGLFDMVHNLLSSGLAELAKDLGMAIGTGFADTGADARVKPTTLLQQSGVYNENDMTIHDFRFTGRAEYLRYQTAFLTKFPAALLQNILSGVLKSFLGSVPVFIHSLLIGILGSTIGDIGSIVGMLFPFTLPYSMAENQDLPNNPLQGLKQNGWLTEGDIAENGSVPTLRRDVSYGEKSVYARVKLNSNFSYNGVPLGMLESIKLFVNGARYGNTNMGIVNGNDFSLANDTIEKTPKQTVFGGVVNQAAQTEINNWIKKYTVNDYIVIDDYALDPNTGKEYLFNRYYVRNLEENPMDDEYFELDIINNGLYLKSVKSLGAYCNLEGNGSYGTEITLPDEVIFNNPYDLSDFTVKGGSWAAQTGGIRSNADRSKTVVELNGILPTRNKVAFQNGGSIGSSGAGVTWSLSLIDFDPEGGEYVIIGSCLNQEIRIKCTVMPRVISTNDVLNVLDGGTGMQAIPDIDPYNFNEADYIKSLPKSFKEGTQVIRRLDQINPEAQTGKYVFDRLTWDLSDVVVTNGGTEPNKPYYIHLTYGFNGSGRGSVDVPVAVMNRTISAVSVAVNGSLGGTGITGSEVSFDPFEISAADAKDALRKTVNTIALLNTASGSVETKIRAVNLGTFANADFNNLSYNADGKAAYTIYITVHNSDGVRTRIPVKVVVQDKRISSTSLDDFSKEERTIYPFRKGGMYDKDIGLNNLPSSIEVRYKDSTTKTITHGTDYVWGLDLGNGRIVYQGKNKDGVDNWRGLMAATGGTYTFRIFGLEEKERDIYGTTYSMNIIVEPTVLTSVLPITFNPYDTIRLPKQMAVGVNGAAPDQNILMNVRWLTLKDEMISANFTGSVHYSEIEVYDVLFSGVTLPGAQVTVKQANIQSMVFADQYQINPYLAAGQIEKLLADSRTYLTVLNAPGVRVSKDLFDVISYRITDASLSRVRISVKVGNKGYKEGDKSTQVWAQEFVMSLVTLDMTRAIIEPITVGTVYDGLPQEVDVSLNGQTYKVPVSYLYDSMTNNTIDNVADMAKNFYKTYENYVPFVPKNLTSVKQTVTVYVNANKAERNEVQTYTLDGAWDGNTLYTFDNVPLPKTGSLTFKDGTVKTGIAVVWDEAHNYQNANGEVVFKGRVGEARYGYYAVEYKVTLTKDSIGITSLPELIKIDPLKDIAAQLALYSTVEANTAGGTAILDTEFPIGSINLSWEGTGELVYKVKVGRRIALTKGDAFVYEEKDVKIQVLRREAAIASEGFVGNIYKEVDFAAMKEITVVFESGEIKTSKISLSNWNGLGTINYSKANVYMVQLTVFSDIPNLTQTIDVKVTVKSAVLVAAYRGYANGKLIGKVNVAIGEQDENGTALSYMIVDPFVGFDKELMPNKLYAQFDGFDEPMQLSADWSVDHIIFKMSVMGGDFTNANRDAGRVTLFLEKDGQRIRPQQLSFEVRVEKSTVDGVQFSKDANAGENGAYDEALIYDQEKNDEKLDTDRRTYYKLFLNPYELTSYNENPNDKLFSYYKAIKIAMSNSGYRFFNVENLEYQIYDKNTLLPTVLSDLYRGRDVIVRMIGNKENIKVNGKQVLASDAIITVEIAVRIYNMSYTSGGLIPLDFTVDLYKEYFYYDDTSAVVSLAELMANIKDVEEKVTISGTDVLNGTGGTPVSADFVGVKASKARLNVNAVGNMGYIDYTFGNSVGGIQTASVPITYMKRELVSVINKDEVFGYYTMKEDQLFTSGQYDPYMKIDQAYTKNFTEGFIVDPFDYNSPIMIKPTDKDGNEQPDTRGVKVGAMQFKDESGQIVENEREKEEDAYEWIYNKIYYDLNGGDFTLTAELKVSAGGVTLVQTVKYRYRVLKRKVVAATSVDDPRADNLKALLTETAKTTGIRAYDYIQFDDYDAAVGKDMFVQNNQQFTVDFLEGCSLDYNLGVNAQYVEKGEHLYVPEGYAENGTGYSMNMSFEIDSLKPLNSKGNDVRFKMTIPGYGYDEVMGSKGRQSVYLYVKSVKQEIVNVKTWLTDSREPSNARPFIDFFRSGKETDPEFTGTTNKPAIEAIDENSNAVMVNNQYFFINRGGLQLPSALLVTVSDGKGGTTSYVVENVNWTGSRANFFNLSYEGGIHQPTFSMPVDNQVYNFRVESGAMNFQGADGTMFDTTSTAYADGQVLLLPTKEALVSSSRTEVTDGGRVITDTASYIAGENYGYSVTFSNGEKVNFSGINGGGNYRNGYNKWDFTIIDFSEYGTTQYAALVLGGRGGERVKWAIRISDKKLVSNSMQTVQLATAGNSANANVSFDFSRGDMGALGGNESGRLPNKYLQYFNNNSQSDAIPVSYKGYQVSDGSTAYLLSDEFGNAIDENGKAVTNFTYNPASTSVGIISKNVGTAAPPLSSDGEKAMSTVAAIEWTATTFRAYPAPTESVSGYLYLAMLPYMQTLSNKNVDAYLRNPDNTNYSYNNFAPEGKENGWTAPTGLQLEGVEQGEYFVPMFATPDGGSTAVAQAQDAVPIYQVKKGSIFDTKYLPLFTLGGSVYYVPWNLASVYYTNKNTDFTWDYNNAVVGIPSASTSLPNGSVFSCQNGTYNATLSGGIKAIDTSDVGARYTLVLNIPGGNAANGNFRIIVAIDIVS